MILEDIYALDESSGYSLEGSFTPDLVFSKLWLISELAKIAPKIDTVYALGSWYGNLALMLDHWKKLRVGKVINVEKNPKFLKGSKQLLDQLGVDNVEYMLKDANDIDYRQLGRRGVVVNTSLIDIPGTDWFENIPPGTLVVMQARDHVEDAQFSSPADVEQKFPLSQVLYSGELELEDPETEYTRFMVIGVK